MINPNEGKHSLQNQSIPTCGVGITLPNFVSYLLQIVYVLSAGKGERGAFLKVDLSHPDCLMQVSKLPSGCACHLLFLPAQALEGTLVISLD